MKLLRSQWSLTTQVPVTVPRSGPAHTWPLFILTPYLREYIWSQSVLLTTLSTTWCSLDSRSPSWVVCPHPVATQLKQWWIDQCPPFVGSFYRRPMYESLGWSSWSSGGRHTGVMWGRGWGSFRRAMSFWYSVKFGWTTMESTNISTSTPSLLSLSQSPRTTVHSPPPNDATNLLKIINEN